MGNEGLSKKNELIAGQNTCKKKYDVDDRSMLGNKNELIKPNVYTNRHSK